MITVGPSQTNILAALRSFLLSVLPSGQALFSGSINGTTMSVSSTQSGTIAGGDRVLGLGVTPWTVVTGTTMSAGLGTCQISPSQVVPGPVVLSTGVPVLLAQINRVAEPPNSDFVIMTMISQDRIETNIDGYIDAVFTGSIAGTLMTITAVDPAFAGTIGLGSPIFGVGVATGTVVTALGSGHGGVGTYTVGPSQAISSETLAAGASSLLQPTEWVVQLDVHGPNSADNAQIITTAFRDDYAVAQFATSGFPIAPLYTDGPKQIPFVNDQQQYETRWVIEAHLQANQTVTIPQQFAAAVDVGLIEVDAVYPP